MTRMIFTAALVGLFTTPAAAACRWERIAPDPTTQGCHGTVPGTSESNPNLSGVWCVRAERHMVWFDPPLSGNSTGRQMIQDTRWVSFTVTHRRTCGGDQQ